MHTKQVTAAWKVYIIIIPVYVYVPQMFVCI